MCIIAGYSGNQNAAPILIEMMKKEEYIDGGLSTGIATIHEGKLYYAKAKGGDGWEKRPPLRGVSFLPRLPRQQNKSKFLVSTKAGEGRGEQACAIFHPSKSWGKPTWQRMWLEK